MALVIGIMTCCPGTAPYTACCCIGQPGSTPADAAAAVSGAAACCCAGGLPFRPPPLLAASTLAAPLPPPDFAFGCRGTGGGAASRGGDAVNLMKSTFRRFLMARGERNMGGSSNKTPLKKQILPTMGLDVQEVKLYYLGPWHSSTFE